MPPSRRLTHLDIRSCVRPGGYRHCTTEDTLLICLGANARLLPSMTTPFNASRLHHLGLQPPSTTGCVSSAGPFPAEALEAIVSLTLRRGIMRVGGLTSGACMYFVTELRVARGGFMMAEDEGIEEMGVVGCMGRC